jgi:3-hydroxyacyl-CoA dehydrogenase/enoyl-CoA hydratase/3-hydroxybutyryl-CoA epimerase
MAPIETSQTFATGLSLTELRLVLPIINEAARCLEERIVSEAWMVDLAMVLGTGFAPFRGGPLRLADNLGISKVVADMRTLETLCGDRFVPCSLLIKLSDTKDKFFSTKKLEEKNGNKPKPETMKVEN